MIEKLGPALRKMMKRPEFSEHAGLLEKRAAMMDRSPVASGAVEGMPGVTLPSEKYVEKVQNIPGMPGMTSDVLEGASKGQSTMADETALQRLLKRTKGFVQENPVQTAAGVGGGALLGGAMAAGGHGEPDADNFGGPSDNDADNMGQLDPRIQMMAMRGYR